MAEKTPFGPFALLGAAKSTLGAVLAPLFGPFLDGVLGSSVNKNGEDS
jgi:hypothetical protein